MDHGRFKDVMRTLIVIVVLALPVLAEEKKAEPAKAAPAQEAAPAAAAATSATAQPDSPLVAAAKRANRLGRKPARTVITNESLKTSGANAHVTTTSSQTKIEMPAPLEPPRATPEMIALKEQQDRRAKAAVEAEKARKAKEEQQRKLEEAASRAEEGFDGTQDDAAEFTGTTPPPPQ